MADRQSPPPPPPYTVQPPTPPKEITLLLLGPPSSGKSTFLSRLPQIGKHPITASTPLTPVDLESQRPFTFHVSLFHRPYTMHIYPSTATLFTDAFPANPAFVVLTYAIDDRTSLLNTTRYWRRQVSSHYPHLEHELPIMLLGLKRELRTAERDDSGEYTCVMPEEGMRAASEMRADRYAECSALTGELLWEVVEDITRVAALTTTEKGGQSEGGFGCCLM